VQGNNLGLVPDNNLGSVPGNNLGLVPSKSPGWVSDTIRGTAFAAKGQPAVDEICRVERKEHSNWPQQSGSDRLEDRLVSEGE